MSEVKQSDLTGLLYFRQNCTGAVYKTGGQYAGHAWVLLNFGWIISANFTAEDLLDSAIFTKITESEI